MTLAAAVQGAKRPSQTITWADENGAAVNLTGATITAAIRDARTGEARASDGTFTVTSASSGVFRWDYGDEDVEEAGSFEVQFTAQFGTGTTPQRSIIESWLVHDSIEIPAP